MKKITAFLLAVVMVLSLTTTAFAASVTPEFSTTAVKAGEDVTVTLTLDEAVENVVSLEYRLYFDTNLFTLKSSTKGTAHSAMDISALKSDKKGMHYSIGMVDTTSEGQTIAAGTLYTLVFTANADLTEAQSVAFELVNKGVYTPTYSTIDVPLTSTSISVAVEPANVSVTGITLDMTALELTVEETATLTATVDPENATDNTVTWSSSDETVATVVDGVVTAVAAGTATITAEAGDQEATCVVTVSEKQEEVPAVGYTFATSADVSALHGGTAVVHVKITGHSDENITSYNAYDVTLNFDSDKLELATDENGDFIYSGAVKSDKGSVTVEGSTIRIVGCGADKGFGTEIAALTFKTKGEGQANVTIDKVQVSDKEESVKEDAPEATPKHDEDDTGADETPDVSVIVVPYSVSKPSFITGNDKVVHGETYTFSYTDTTNYTYADLTVKVGGVAVENLVADENGVYTIENVTGAIVITATQTPNSYDVNKPGNVTGPDKATYGTPYIFTVTPSEEDMAIDDVKVTDAEGNEIPYTINENGEYVIEGTDITGEFTITVTEKEKMTTVTFSGIEETEIEGGLTQTAEIGKEFTFQLIKEEGYDYTVKVGETELTESEETEGQYTIPAELVVKGGVAVTIEKVDNTKPVVDVAEYISLDGKVMFLVTAKWGDKVLSYGENTMFWSDKYTVTGEEEAGAYCWLVLSTDEMNTIELVKAAAEAAIVEAAEGATATAVKYNYDVNGTTKVDVNDAQLAYDMYNASYMEFNDNLPMQKFLEADMETDGKLDTKDVAAIISYIVSGANA